MVSKINEVADKIDPSQHHLLINDYFSTLTDQSHIVIKFLYKMKLYKSNFTKNKYIYQVLSAAINQLEKFLKLFIKPGSNGILNDAQVIKII